LVTAEVALKSHGNFSRADSVGRVTFQFLSNRNFFKAVLLIQSLAQFSFPAEAVRIDRPHPAAAVEVTGESAQSTYFISSEEKTLPKYIFNK
jgi:hypothetical protein